MREYVRLYKLLIGISTTFSSERSITKHQKQLPTYSNVSVIYDHKVFLFCTHLNHLYHYAGR